VSLWDIDLKNGKLTRRLELGRNVDWPAFLVVSPAAGSLITPAWPSVEESPGSQNEGRSSSGSTTDTLVVRRIGKGPRPIPFQLSLQGATDSSHPSLMYEPIRSQWEVLPQFPLKTDWGRICFIDETTLVYTGTDYRLWRFDLDTWESELLWAPASASDNPSEGTEP
jgi:hypothetical protein